MALKSKYKSKYGIEAENAYHRIQRVRGSQSTDVSYDIEIYFNQAARLGGAKPLEIERRVIPQELLSSLSVTHELYEILKKEPEYDGYAVDVFESGVFPYFYTAFTGAYIVKASIVQGYDANTKQMTNGIIDGKVIIDNKVVLGRFLNIEGENIFINGEGDIIKGWINFGSGDGYVVQFLLGD